MACVLLDKAGLRATHLFGPECWLVRALVSFHVKHEVGNGTL
ncbi:MAG: hypothetical protein KatS3mg077_2316 [Candidatus Binatia bacterium]|nr:MAG: hypothetical protein KatS3mg077_2316 [Candidatus Binatia bacterium]